MRQNFVTSAGAVVSVFELYGTTWYYSHVESILNDDNGTWYIYVKTVGSLRHHYSLCR
jgi:hypothetical protein